MMKKFFNDTGACFPEEHYMVDISNKIKRMFEMLDRGNYFVINRPRQYGKTTLIGILNRFLKSQNDFFPIKISFEGIGADGFQDSLSFIEAFLSELKNNLKTAGNNNIIKFINTNISLKRIDELGIWLSELIRIIGKKTVLMIDEVDKSSNNQLFLDFLGMLRNKYLKRREEGEYTFYSVILAGVHDVKNLKLKIRQESDTKFNSPWNIAVNFNLDLSFEPIEISSMLKHYTEETGIKMDIDAIAASIFYYTSGYPFLVSKICKIIDEEILPGGNKDNWTQNDVEKAINLLLKEKNTNFENLVKNLENNKDLYDLVRKITLSDEKFGFNVLDPLIDKGIIYGIFKTGGPLVEIHNRIYKELILDYMTSIFKREAILKSPSINYSLEFSYLKEDGTFDFEKVLLKFQEFMKKEYSSRDEEFLERHGRLIFLAFLKPILNGKGYDFKEAQASEEKRMDVIVTYDNKKFIIELKIWRGQKLHEKGILQLTDYLESQGMDTGYLIIFDFIGKTKKGKIYKKKHINANGKVIFAVWV